MVGLKTPRVTVDALALRTVVEGVEHTSLTRDWADVICQLAATSSRVIANAAERRVVDAILGANAV